MTTRGSGARTAFASVVLLVAAASTSGCGWIATRMARSLAEQQISRKFTLMSGRAAAYRECLESTGGVCPDETGFDASKSADLGAKMPLRIDPNVLRDTQALGADQPSAAARALMHPVQTRLNELYNVLSELPAASISGFDIEAPKGRVERVQLRLPTRDVEEYVGLIAQATQGDEWQTLAGDAQSLDADSTTARVASYVAAYVRAYFRGGEFFSIKIDSNSDPIKALKERFPLVGEKMLRELFSEFKAGNTIFGGIGPKGFVTRTGAIYQFPAVDMRLDPIGGRMTRGSDVEMASVAADLVRVVLEAVFDAHGQLPAVTGATGVTVAGSPLQVHDPSKSPVKAPAFAEVNRMSNQAEAAVSAALGPAIRGAGWISLNNESLAKLIETFVAVTVRKVTEKAAWCFYACQAGQSEAGSDLGAPVEMELIVGGWTLGSEGFHVCDEPCWLLIPSGVGRRVWTRCEPIMRRDGSRDADPQRTGITWTVPLSCGGRGVGCASA
jgi:hypothetical protein